MLRDLLAELQRAFAAGIPVVHCALVETRGSTPQKAGAAMLVFPDGSQVGTLGGGCVEAEVKRRALHILDAGRREILTFQLDDNYGWDDGLICGGRMKMLVDPVRPGDDHAYFARLSEFAARGQAATEAVLIDDERYPSDAGSRFLFDDGGRLVGARGAAAPPAEAAEGLRPVRSRPRPYVTAGVSYLPILERCRLIIVGGGHVGHKVAQLAHEVDFDVWVVDDRQEYCNPDRFPQARRLIVAPIGSALSGLDVDENTYCLIVTRGHQHDEEALYHLAETPARYVGMIGSRRKIRLIFDDLLADGISREALSRVHAPIGLEIGSQTVPEIAVSIVAELIAHRNLGASLSPLRPPNLLTENSVPAG